MYLSFTIYKIYCVKRFKDYAELHYNTRTSKYLMFFCNFQNITECRIL